MSEITWPANPSWKANISTSSQNNPRTLRKSKGRYHTHERSPRVSEMSHMNPVHERQHYNLKIHLIVTSKFALVFQLICLPQVPTPITVQSLPSTIPSTRPAPSSLLIWSAEYNFVINADHEASLYANPPVTRCLVTLKWTSSTLNYEAPHFVLLCEREKRIYIHIRGTGQNYFSYYFNFYIS